MTRKRGLLASAPTLGGLILWLSVFSAPNAQTVTPKLKSFSQAHDQTASTPAAVPVDTVSDDAPPSTYDLTQGKTAHSVHPETTQLLWQLVRTVVALAAVLALIFVLAKVLLPRLTHRFTAGDPALLQIKSRLRLDESHQAILLEIRGGKEVLLALGPSGAQLICSVTQPEGKPSATFTVDAAPLLGNS